MRSYRRIAGALATAAALAGSALGAGDGRITVAPETTVAGESVRLGDVAALQGDAAERLAGLVLGRAPAAGERRAFDGAAVLQAIAHEAGGLSGLTYTIPTVLRVRRASQEVDEFAQRRIVEDFLTESLGPGAADAVVRAVDAPGRIVLPTGAYRARVMPTPGAPVWGRVRLPVEFVVDDRPVRTVTLTADIGLYGSVVMAHRPIARGETLTAADLTVERRDLSETPQGAITVPADASGRVARAPIAPYAPIRREQLGTAAAVHRGDAVLLVAERGALRITAAGEARDDAGVGEHVRVVNRASQKTLIGRVVDGSTVGVEF